MSLYRSGYTPRGVCRSWERCSMGLETSGDVLRRKGCLESYGDPVDAVAWFDDEGALRVLIADYPNGRRVTLRMRLRDSLLEIGPMPTSALAAERGL